MYKESCNHPVANTYYFQAQRSFNENRQYSESKSQSKRLQRTVFMMTMSSYTRKLSWKFKNNIYIWKPRNSSLTRGV